MSVNEEKQELPDYVRYHLERCPIDIDSLSNEVHNTLAAMSPAEVVAAAEIVRKLDEAAKRFRELVHTAVEQFNEGQLGRAVAIFELAQRLAAEEKVERAFVDPVRAQGHASLDADRLRKFAERTDCRAPLRALHVITRMRTGSTLKAKNTHLTRASNASIVRAHV